MIGNYLTVALRQLVKHKAYAGINIACLAVGLCVYLFGTMAVSYERNHDGFWEHADRIYSAGTVFGPAANIGVSETDGIYTAFAPFIKTDLPFVAATARTVGEEFLVTVNDNHFYEDLTFTDPEFVEIFDFEYLEGSAAALQEPMSLILSQTLKNKLFGAGPALGKTVSLDHDHSLHVAAVIADLRLDSHLQSSIVFDRKLHAIAPLSALHTITGYPLEGNYNNLSSGDNTYLLLQPGHSLTDLQQGLNSVYERHFPEQPVEFVAGLKARPLAAMNTMLWDAVGLPIMDSVLLLGILVLMVAVVNYTNLATAQSLGRSREIGLRKTVGASRGQLMVQFMTESLVVTVIAMVTCIIALAILIPWFNSVSGKAMPLSLWANLPWLITTTLIVAVCAGAYPAYTITRTSPIQALRDGGQVNVRGAGFRTGMLILQFSISIFMLAMVTVIYLQNRKVEESAGIYPKTQVLTLSRLRVESINDRLDTLRNEIIRLPGVTQMGFTSQLPYNQSNSGFNVTRVMGDRDNTLLLNQIFVDDHFFAAIDIPLLAGRNLDRSITGDTVTDTKANVVVNELALAKLGMETPAQAIGKQFFDRGEGEEIRAYTIVGVVPDQNYQGFHNEVKPLAFKMLPRVFSSAAIRIESDDIGATRTRIEDLWTRLIPDYPIQSAYLQDEFLETYAIYQGIARIVGGFAFVAMSLSLIGLFGLAAFMAATRTKEIGLRKVMGATTAQLTRLLIWRFSKPVMWALLIALPLAYLAANEFLQFFADRIGFIEGIVGAAGVTAVAFAWLVVGIHAARVAAAKPIIALRHE